jgi:hypothetical protein
VYSVGSVSRSLALATVLVVLVITGVVAYQRYSDLTSELEACRTSLRVVLGELRELQAYSTSLYSNYTTLWGSYLQLRNYTTSLLANCSIIESSYRRVSEELRSALVELELCREVHRRLSEDLGRLSESYETALRELQLLRGALPLLITLHRQFLNASATSFSYSNGTLTVASVATYTVYEAVVSRVIGPRVGDTTLYLATPKPGFVVLEVNTSGTGCYRVEVSNTYYIANYSSSAVYYRREYCGSTTTIIPVLPHQTTLRVVPHYVLQPPLYPLGEVYDYRLRIRYLQLSY